MFDLQKLRNKESLKAGDYSNKIRNRLQELKIKLSPKAEGIPTDLGDIQEICNKYLTSINMLFSKDVENNKFLLIEIFNYIYSDFYIHLDYHLKSLKKPLNILIMNMEKEK